MASPVIDFRVRLPLELRPSMQTPAAVREQYDAVLDISANSTRTLEDLKTEMAQTGVDHAVVHAEYEFGDPAELISMTDSLRNAQIHHGIGDFRMTERDLEVRNASSEFTAVREEMQSLLDRFERHVLRRESAGETPRAQGSGRNGYRFPVVFASHRPGRRESSPPLPGLQRVDLGCLAITQGDLPLSLR